ncbi:MAG: DNA-binding protein [Lachnospiraceae bacterium]|nr:DNA-binding protein [Lachnospiraceae bacterium]
MEKVVEQTLLYDFYGELLNSHQKEIYEAIVFDDMSYSEVATEKGISRQGVFDAMKRCDHILKEYEEKLHLVERFLETRRQAAEIKRLAENVLKENTSDDIRLIIKIAVSMTEM